MSFRLWTDRDLFELGSCELTRLLLVVYGWQSGGATLFPYVLFHLVHIGFGGTNRKVDFLDAKPCPTRIANALPPLLAISMTISGLEMIEVPALPSWETTRFFLRGP